ncbi:MAG: heavy-metal-associated domain-containing protein [Campylobacterota bacterium]
MQYSIEVDNIKCGGCATTVKNELGKLFEEVEIDLEKMPRVVTVKLEEDQIPLLRQKLKTMGYPACDENLEGLQNATAKAKSFISCATGKFENISKK